MDSSVCYVFSVQFLKSIITMGLATISPDVTLDTITGKSVPDIATCVDFGRGFEVWCDFLS